MEFYLNGFTIEQSQQHALLQRFFSVIELNDSPFLRDTGPADFVADDEVFLEASNVLIQGPGKIGRSSHHGIHGNSNRNIQIRNVIFEDFEVAAVSLNNVDNLVIERCVVTRNRHNVPVVGLFSAARFIRSPYGEKLVELDYSMRLRGTNTTARSVYDRLTDSINAVYKDVMENGQINQTEHPEEYDLFHNPFQVIDGPCYAFLIHGHGPAVGGFGLGLDKHDSLTSSNIIIRNNDIRNIKCWTNEVPAAVEKGIIMNDARGAVFQFIRSMDNTPISRNKNGTYRGNVVADMQIMVAKAIQDGVLKNSPLLQTTVNSIDKAMIEWAQSSALKYTPKYRCNGDSMHHFNKGIVVIRVEDTVGFEITNNRISNVRNFSPKPFQHCADYHIGGGDGDVVREGPNIRAISVSAVSGYESIYQELSVYHQYTDNLPVHYTSNVPCSFCSRISDNIILDMKSKHASLISGINIQGVSEFIKVEGNTIDLGEKKQEETDVYVSLKISEVMDTLVAASNSIEVNDNNFMEKIIEVYYDLEPTTGLGFKKNSGCPFSGQRVTNEWALGSSPGSKGCPGKYMLVGRDN